MQHANYSKLTVRILPRLSKLEAPWSVLPPSTKTAIHTTAFSHIPKLTPRGICHCLAGYAGMHATVTDFSEEIPVRNSLRIAVQSKLRGMTTDQVASTIKS